MKAARESTRVSLIAVSVLAVSIAARADSIDETLMDTAPRLLDLLRERSVTNVGVLPFRIAVGARPTFDVKLAYSMSRRLEDALVVALDAEQPLVGIVHDAGGYSSRHLSRPSYRTANDRRLLFDIDYPLAWGVPRKTVTLDAFVTGKLVFTKDLRSVNIEIEMIDRRTPTTVEDLFSVAAKTDRWVLGEAGISYSGSRGNSAPVRAVTEDDIIESATSTKPAFAEFPVELTVMYDGIPQQIRPDSDSFKLLDPKKGQRVVFRMKNKTEETVGAVLTVNGINTLGEETGAIAKMQRWVLEPGKLYEVKGFHKADNQSYTPIIGYSDQASKEVFNDLGPNAGVLQLFVFRRGGNQDKAEVPAYTRGLNQATKKARAQARSPAELQSQIVAASMPQAGVKGLMLWAKDDVALDLETRKLGPVELTDSMSIRYYGARR